MFRLSNKKALGQGLSCKVQLLVPGEEVEISYGNNSTGQDILNDVAAQLELLDKDYYGLKLYDHIQWIDLTKSVVKQTKGVGNVVFILRFKYYPAEPALLANESTRYYLYLQLRSDLLEGRLKSESQDTLAYLVACVLQSELGDANSSPEISYKENYVDDFKFVPNQTESLELAAIALHQSEDFLGLRAADAELNFLKKACQLDTYGIDPYPVKDGNSSKHFLIGVNHLGISTFQDSKRTNLFKWDDIERITLDNKLVVIYCRIEKSGEKVGKIRTLCAFRCPSQEHAQSFWKISTEHKFFFTLEATPDSPIVTNTGGFFKKSHKLKYAGRVEKDLLRDHVDESRSSSVKRSRSLMIKTNNGRSLKASNNLLTTMDRIYKLDAINKTFPANMNDYREEEEGEAEGGGAERRGKLGDNGARYQQHGAAGMTSEDSAGQRNYLSHVQPGKDSPKTFNNRKSVLTAKSEVSAAAIRRSSQIYMDEDQDNHEFIRATIFLFLIMGAIFLTVLLINDADRPNSVSYILRRLGLEHASTTLRHTYYLPLKSALRTIFGQIFTILDSKLL